MTKDNMLRATVEQVRVDGLPMWRLTVMDWMHQGPRSLCTARVAWFADWSKAISAADLATHAPDHPALGGVQWCDLLSRPSPSQMAERLALIGRREAIPRIGLAAAMAEVGAAALSIEEACS